MMKWAKSLVILLLIFWGLASNLLGSGKFLAVRVGTITLRSGQSYDEKMERTFGLYYDFMVFIRQNTPPNAIIAAPQGFRIGPYPLGGGYSTYFLYPRRMVSGTDVGLPLGEPVTHVVIVTGKHGRWPPEPLPPGKVTYMPRRVRVFIDDLEVCEGEEQHLLEDFESLRVPVLFPADSHPGPVINAHRIAKVTLAERIERFGNKLLGGPYTEPSSSSGLKSEYLDITYTGDNYDYWGTSTNIPLAPQTAVGARVMVTGIAQVSAPEVEHSAVVFATVSFADGNSKAFHSQPIQTLRRWETLKLENLYAIAKECGVSNGWDTNIMAITRIGLVICSIPFEDWGIIELSREGS